MSGIEKMSTFMNRGEGAGKRFSSSLSLHKQQENNSLLSLKSYLTSDNDITFMRQQVLADDEKDDLSGDEMLHAFMKCLTMPHQHFFATIEQYKEICNEVVDLLKNNTKSFFPVPSKKVRMSKSLSLLMSELNTWMLIQVLYKERLCCDSKSGNKSHQQIDIKDSEQELTFSLFNEDSVLRQAQIVIDWLEFQSRSSMENEYGNLEFFSEHSGACRENTLHFLLHKHTRLNSQDNFVSQLDPDAALRENKRLNTLDEDDENKLMFYIFACIKSGQLDEACRMCLKIGQSWRAVTLQGWKLFHDPNIKCLGPGGTLQKTEGNQFRDLWKLACWQMAENDKVSIIERAVYASLSCNLKHLLPACKSWNDFLWAYMKVFVDQKVEHHIRSSLSSTRLIHPLPNNFDVQLHNFERIFSEIEGNHLNQEVKNQSRHKFNIIQKFIMLDQLEVLMEFMSQWCKEETTMPHPILLRFMTHLVLFFKSCGVSFSAHHEATVIAAYVDWLICEGQVELIATYTSYLPSSLQVSMYTKFLEGITGTENRRHSLDLAEAASLDTKLIAMCVVQNICKQIPFLDKNIFHSLLSQDVTQDDMKKIDAIEWLLLDSSWRLEAVQQSNALFRMFICFKKIQACNMLIKKLPNKSIETIVKSYGTETKRLPTQAANSIRELMCVTAYLEAQESFSKWFDHLHNGRPHKPVVSDSFTNLADKVSQEHVQIIYEENVRKWQKYLVVLADLAISKIKEVLEFADGGWMVDQENDESGYKTRQQEMILLRQLCLPFLFTLLRSIFHSMERYEECLQLYDFLMSEQHQLYKVFSEEELERFSAELIASSVSSLNCQLDPLGYPLF